MDDTKVAEVAMCVLVSITQNGGKLAKEHGSCIDAKKGESNPLWLLRRRNGGA